MSPTRTKTPDAHTAEERLTITRQEHDDVLEQIASGKPITAAQLADSEAALRLAELELDAALNADARAAEQARAEELNHLVEELRSAIHRERLSVALAAYDEAVAAIAALHAAAVAYCEPLRSTRYRIAALRRAGSPIPDSLTRQGSEFGAGTAREAITVDETTYPFDRRIPARLIAEAVRSAVPASVRRDVEAGVRTLPYPPTKRLRRIVDQPAERSAAGAA